MKSFLKTFICAFILFATISCSCENNSDKISDAERSRIESKAEYYFRQGEIYGSIYYISDGNLTYEEQRDFERLLQEEENYINSLSSEGRDIYYNRLQELQ